MAEFRVYVTAPRRFRISGALVPDFGPFEMHMVSGRGRICASGFWCLRCHPQIEVRIWNTSTTVPRDTLIGLAGR